MGLQSERFHCFEMDVDRLVILDSDGQHESYLPAVLAQLDVDDVDVVIGSRFMEESKRFNALYRRLGISTINNASNLTSYLGVKDTQMARAFNRRALNLLAFENEGMESTFVF